ncbi:MAG TPA: DUF3592 domain-containing protein [Bradyrhizobium sp.]|nr:DUF3592 domain-containing protein [Bradyrhizobium sp.]
MAPGLRRGDARGELAPMRLLPGAVIASVTFSPGCALADSAIDRAVKPYFVGGGWLAALVFLGIGFVLLSRAMRYRRAAAAAMQWPVADGVVLATDIVKRISKSDDEFDSYVPRVRYAYTVDGVRREGDVIRIGLGDLGYVREQQARDHLARYPVGASIAVRYDPQQPQAAVLEIGQLGATRYLLAGGLLGAVGVGAVVFAIWSATLPVQ